MLRQLKAQGYDVHLFFCGVESVDLALLRVRERVVRGGHEVPEAVVRRRFDRSMQTVCFTIAGGRVSGHYLRTRTQLPRVIAFEVRIIDSNPDNALVKRYGRT